MARSYILPEDACLTVDLHGYSNQPLHRRRATPRPRFDTSDLICRILASHRFTNVLPPGALLPRWHLPSEKLYILPMLCQRALKPYSRFWQVPLTGLGNCLGKFLDVTA